MFGFKFVSYKRLRPGKSRLCEDPHKALNYYTSSGDEEISIVDAEEEIASSLQSYFKIENFLRAPRKDVTG